MDRSRLPRTGGSSARGYGLADIKTRRPVTPETLFCIASVTKAISAVAAPRLVDERKLDLNARLVDVLADLTTNRRFGDPRFRDITVHHLCSAGPGLSRDSSHPVSCPLCACLLLACRIAPDAGKRRYLRQAPR